MSSTTYRIAFLGPPGAGKGTQAERLASVLDVPIIGPGALYRREMAEGTDIGKRVTAVVTAGDMVPNEITRAVMERRLTEPDCAHGFILDGYPRDLVQTEDLDHIAPSLTHAVLLTIDEAEVLHRLADRLVCVCGKQFNRRELVIDAGDEARCTACDGALERRKDDNLASIQHRIALYRDITEPVIARYRERGILIEINGQRPIEDVHADILAKLGV